MAEKTTSSQGSVDSDPKAEQFDPALRGIEAPLRGHVPGETMHLHMMGRAWLSAQCKMSLSHLAVVACTSFVCISVCELSGGGCGSSCAAACSAVALLACDGLSGLVSRVSFHCRLQTRRNCMGELFARCTCFMLHSNYHRTRHRNGAASARLTQPLLLIPLLLVH